MGSKKAKSGSIDEISSLPDETLAQILTFLPTKRAASTCILSKRWKYLFPLMNNLFTSQHHLYFDDSDLVYPEEEEGKSERKDIVHQSFRDFVDKTLCDSNKPIKKLSLKCQDGLISFDLTDQWIRKAMERGVVDLDLRLKARLVSGPILRIPTSVFGNKTLVKLTLGIDTGHLVTSFPVADKRFLPVLKSLTLHAVWSLGERLCYKMIPCCPILEELFLHYGHEARDTSSDVQDRRLVICHKTLKRLTVHYKISIGFTRIVHFNTPSLVYLDFSGFSPYSQTGYLCDSLVDAKLDIKQKCRYFSSDFPGLDSDYPLWIFKLVCNVKNLSLSSACVKMLYLNGMRFPFFWNLVKLSFESYTKKGWKMLSHLLNKTPRLETLVLKGLHCVKNEGVCIDPTEVTLTVLEIYGFKGRNKEFRQVGYFLSQMYFLQVMKVELDADDSKKQGLINRLLDLPQRSSKCQIQIL